MMFDICFLSQLTEQTIQTQISVISPAKRIDVIQDAKTKHALNTKQKLKSIPIEYLIY